MADRPEPRLLRSDEFDELMTMLDRYFSSVRRGLAARLPFAYDRERPERHAVIAVDGEIVSHAACIPQTLVAGDARIECFGIGGVATAKPHRGNGYMTSLLEFWLDRMDEAGAVLSDLGGDRTRYGRFGWERAGEEVVYRVTPRTAPEAASGGDVVTYEDDDGQLATLRSLHGEHDLRVRRDEDTARAVYGQRGLETLLYYDENGTARAYVCLSRGGSNRSIREFGGDSNGVEALVAHSFEWYDLEEVTVYAHPNHPVNRQLVALSSSWRTQPSRLLNVRDLPAIIEVYGDALERRWERAPLAIEGDIAFGIDGEDAAVRLRYSPEGLSVESFDGDPKLSLSRSDATRLIFGGGGRRESVVSEYPVLDALFPLDFYIWPTERV